MSDNDRDSGGGRLWAGLRGLLFGSESEPTLRDQIEEAIVEHEDEAPAKGDLSGPERKMLRNLLDFGERTAGDVGVPRGEIIAVPETIAFADLVTAFAEAGHSRLPVYRDSLDEVIGMIHVKDVFAILALGQTPPETLAPLIRQPRYVPESMGIIDLLAEMRTHRIHLAIVLDEYSGTEGLVTIEDIVEEIVGEIEDEHDDAPTALLVALDDGIWDADARAELEEVAEVIDPGWPRSRRMSIRSAASPRCWRGTCRRSARRWNIRAAGGSKSPTPIRAASRGSGCTRRSSKPSRREGTLL
jgi:magnesium and cobalt transporter